MVWVQLAVVLGMIFVGARLGGVGLGMMGGVGVLVLAFVFGQKPSSPPIEVMLMIAAVCTAAATLQAARGMDYLVEVAEKALRKYPPAITFVAPIVAYLFTLFAGTSSGNRSPHCSTRTPLATRSSGLTTSASDAT